MLDTYIDGKIVLFGIAFSVKTRDVIDSNPSHDHDGTEQNLHRNDELMNGALTLCLTLAHMK